jgi:anti-anti-sigma factor
MPFGVAVEHSEDLTLVHLSGVAGLGDAEQLQLQLTRLTNHETPLLILDLTELQFINSSALGAFIAVHKHCLARGGGVAIVNPREAVAQLLRVTQLDRLLPICDTASAAEQALRQTLASPE